MDDRCVVNNLVDGNDVRDDLVSVDLALDDRGDVFARGQRPVDGKRVSIWREKSRTCANDVLNVVEDAFIDSLPQRASGKLGRSLRPCVAMLTPLAVDDLALLGRHLLDRFGRSFGRDRRLVSLWLVDEVSYGLDAVLCKYRLMIERASALVVWQGEGDRRTDER